MLYQFIFINKTIHKYQETLLEINGNYYKLWLFFNKIGKGNLLIITFIHNKIKIHLILFEKHSKHMF